MIPTSLLSLILFTIAVVLFMPFSLSEDQKDAVRTFYTRRMERWIVAQAKKQFGHTLWRRVQPMRTAQLELGFGHKPELGSGALPGWTVRLPMLSSYNELPDYARFIRKWSGRLVILCTPFSFSTCVAFTTKGRNRNKVARRIRMEAINNMAAKLIEQLFSQAQPIPHEYTRRRQQYR